MRGVANAKDIPAIPNSGMARLLRFRLGLCFVCEIPTFSNTLDPKISTNGPQRFRGAKMERQSITMHCLECALELTSVLVI